MKSHFSFIPSQTKPNQRISPMRAKAHTNFSIFTSSPPFKYISRKQYKNKRSSSTNTSLFLMSPEPQKNTAFSSQSILSPNQKTNGSKSKYHFFHHKTLFLDIYKEEEDDKSDILKVNSNRYFKRRLVDFEYKQRRLSCSCTECGNQSKKQKKLLHVVPNISSWSAKLSPNFKTQPSVMIKSMKSIKSSTTKFSNADLSNKKATKNIVNSLSPQKQFLLKKRDIIDQQLPKIHKSSILIEFQRKKNNLNNLVETSILTSPQARNSAPNLEQYDSPNQSPNKNIKINYLNLQDSYNFQTDRFPIEFTKLKSENHLKNTSFKQQGKNIRDCYLKKSLHRKIVPNSNILLKTFGK